MIPIIIDFETRSAVPIEADLMNYFSSPSAKALCMAYKIGDSPTKMWLPGQPQPFSPNEHMIYGFNVLFDMLAWNFLCPQFTPLPLENCIDVQAICGRFTYPQNLDDATQLLNKKTTKNRIGKSLIKKICVPPFRYEYYELIELYKYCVQDVDATYELLHNLPAKKLSKLEQEIWLLTQRINLKGIPVDVKAAELILQRINAYITEETGRLRDLTDGKINTPGQAVAIRKWVNSCTSLNMQSLNKAAIDEVLSHPTLLLPSNVRSVLKIRRDVGRSSVKKLNTLLLKEHKNRIYFNLKYYGASTGRFAGSGFQAHNLPRDAVKAKDFEDIYETFRDGSVYFAANSPVDYAKMMIRGLIKPTNPLYSLVWFDYRNIESRMLFWLANDYNALDMYKKGEDLYVSMASFILYKDPKDVTPRERFLGKQAILLCGYMGGAKKLKDTANSYNIMEISLDLADQAVKGYRKKYKKVQNLWYTLIGYAINAVETFGLAYEHHDCIFKFVEDKHQVRWLRVTIPSGRNLYYCEPTFSKGMFGKEIRHQGLYNKKWTKLTLSPGRLIENIIQALSRDILVYHKLIIDKKYPIILSIHDEIVCEVSDAEVKSCFDFMQSEMINPPFWCSDVPLDVEGKIKKRYDK